MEGRKDDDLQLAESVSGESRIALLKVITSSSIAYKRRAITHLQRRSKLSRSRTVHCRPKATRVGKYTSMGTKLSLYS